jgi:membrane protease YdiL (CAAX protease family)
MTGPDNAGQVATTTKALEIPLVFLVGLAIVFIGWRLVGADPFARQAVVWVANVAVLGAIWIGLRMRGQTWAHFGLGVGVPSARAFVRGVLQATVVLTGALAAFVAGGAVAMRVASAPDGADMSGYTYLQGNLPMLLLALAAVYIVSSFGEEVIYRGFVMTRLAELGHRTRAAWATALAASAVIFGLAHFDWGLAGIIQTTCMGLALAASYLLVRRNLWVLVLAHACIDTLLLVQLYLGPAATGAE